MYGLFLDSQLYFINVYPYVNTRIYFVLSFEIGKWEYSKFGLLQ